MNTALHTALVEFNKSLKGGPGSGNFGHAGRPGEVGGSAPGGGGGGVAAGTTTAAENMPAAAGRVKDEEKTHLATQRIGKVAPLGALPKFYDHFAKGDWKPAGRDAVANHVEVLALMESWQPKVGYATDLYDLQEHVTQILSRLPENEFDGKFRVVLDNGVPPGTLAGQATNRIEGQDGKMTIYLRNNPTLEAFTGTVIHEWAHLQDHQPNAEPFHIAYKQLVDERIRYANQMYDYSLSKAERATARDNFGLALAKEEAAFKRYVDENLEPSMKLVQYAKTPSGSPEAVSWYASNSTPDQFAEAYSMYVSPFGRAVMEKQYPKTFEFMRGYFSKKKS
jgi:hypothetical protein